jgi:hypothetical protein
MIAVFFSQPHLISLARRAVALAQAGRQRPSLRHSRTSNPFPFNSLRTVSGTAGEHGVGRSLSWCRRNAPLCFAIATSGAFRSSLLLLAIKIGGGCNTPMRWSSGHPHPPHTEKRPRRKFARPEGSELCSAGLKRPPLPRQPRKITASRRVAWRRLVRAWAWRLALLRRPLPDRPRRRGARCLG